MNPLALIPARVYEYAVLLIACAAIGWGFVHHEREIGAARAQAQLQHERAAVAQAAASATAAAASETQRREAAIQEIVHDTQQAASAVAADASAAARERDALRMQLAAVRARAVPAHPASAAGSADQPGEDPIGVLADVLDRADARAGVLAEVAERRRLTAAACEHSWDALGRKAPDPIPPAPR